MSDLATRACDDESPAPAEEFADHAGDQCRRCYAEISPYAVDAHLAAELVGIGHDHGGADRMIDRCKQSNREQRDAQLQRRLYQPDRDHRQADAGEIDHHHVAPAPPVAKPAGRQRPRAKGDEARRGIGQQLRIGHAHGRPHHDHRGGEDQHRVVIDEMADIDVGDDPGGDVHESILH
jgi:hypothetical protein